MRVSITFKLLVPLALLIAILTRKEMSWLLEIFNFGVGKDNLFYGKSQIILK